MVLSMDKHSPEFWAQFFERRKQPRGKQILFTICIEACMTISIMICTKFDFLYFIFEIHVQYIIKHEPPKKISSRD